MFQKNTFGSSTSFGGFGAGSSTGSPFGGFKSPGTSGAFGAAPAFGTPATAQPATGGGLFGSPSTSGGLFGAGAAGAAGAAAAPAFGGGAGGGFGFAQPAPAGGLFGATSATGGGLFGQAQPAASAFGAKPAGFGFNNAATTSTTGGGLFGAGATTGSMFGQPSGTLGGGGLFGTTAAGGFGQQQATGTALVKFSPVIGTDSLVKSGNTTTITIKHHCITCMKEYEGKSLEELRLEDYAAGRRGAAAPGGFGGAAPYAQPADAKPPGGLFGAGAFGQPAATGAAVFGTTSSFAPTNSAFSFGAPTQTSTSTSLFGAAKPTFGATSTAGGGLFGTATAAPTPAFGASSTGGFGFGTTTQPQTSGLFGAKPLGAAPTQTTGFGAFGGGTQLFGANKLATSAAPAFGTPAPAFGSVGAGGAFGTATSTAGGIFGAGALGAKPAAPTFGFGQPNQTLGSTSLLNSFNQSKPTFPSFSTGSAFALPTQTAQPTLGGFGTGGLGGFGTLGGVGGSLGGAALGGAPGTAPTLGLGAGAYAGNVHEQILSLASRPYGDSPLFRDLPTGTGASSEDVLKPTNPAAVKAVLDKSDYRVTSPPDAERLKVFPLGPAPSRNKKSLFDGLEESDASAEVRLSLKPSRKRLVLRPKQNANEDTPHRGSIDDSGAEAAEAAAAAARKAARTAEAPPRRLSGEADVRGVNTDLEEDTERRSSWLGSRISPGGVRSRPASLERGSQRVYPDLDLEGDAEGRQRSGSPRASPRLYPDLDKETSERRSSWLTTKPLRKPGVGASGGAAAAESSVRELRSGGADASPHDDKENVHTLCDGSVHGVCGHRAGSAAHLRCEKISHQIRGIYVSEEETLSGATEGAAHPAGVKLTRAGYYTVPSLQEMIGYMRPDGSCRVPALTIGRRNYGSIRYDAEIDVAGLDLDHLVHFMNKEVMVYPEESEKPPVGAGLNRRAVVTLDRVWPRDKSARELIVDSDRLLKMDYEGKLRRVCDKHNTKFIEYRPETGSWVFRVEHFSKYGLTDSDEEEEAPDVIRRQLLPAPPLAHPAQHAPHPLAATALVGLSGTHAGLGGAPPPAPRTLHLQPRGLAMDTSEENSVDSQTLYPDTSSVFGVKSPTGELSRLDLHSSHRVQLMKASLYSDTLMHDMEDDVSVSTGDQLVPQHASPVPESTDPRCPDDEPPSPPQPLTQEVVMRPLIVRPHTIVLRYHRRVPPFAQTIAGRLGAACIADMAVCRARHSRVGFAPGGRLALLTTQQRLAALPPDGDLSALGDYLSGRGADDWSPAAVARLAVAGRAAAAAPAHYQEAMEGHLLAQLEHSDSTAVSGEACPRLTVKSDPSSRLSLLRAHIRLADALRDPPRHAWGVEAEYWRSVWRLCEALWGGELAAEGRREGGEAATLARRRALACWLRAAVASATDREMALPVAADPDDESDAHSERVLTLMLGGRLVEACAEARRHGDLNMAALIAQASGDAALRQLLERQLLAWRECGALALVSRARALALLLAAGRRALPAAAGAGALDACARLDWLRAFNVHFSYICPQVSSVEEAVRSYEGMFAAEGEAGAAGEGEAEAGEGCDLAAVQERPGLEFPLPPYQRQYEVAIETGGASRRVLDLRYELLRARARRSRPDLQPATHTPDPLDYSLSFLLGSWLEQASVSAVAGAAEQLEAAGAWHLAALALMYHPDDAARAALVRAVVSRHAPARADGADAQARLAFLRSLRVPERWVLLARAHRAKYEGLWSAEAEALAGAGEWNAAHRVLLDKLLPDAVLSDDLERVSGLLERLSAAAAGERVAGWASGGEALYLYLHVCNEIRGLVSEGGEIGGEGGGARAALHARLEALRPRVAAACRALGALAAPTARHAAARSEMAARLLQLAVCAGAGAPQLAAALRALRLPPDVQRPFLHKITTELAEQASEACAASGDEPRSMRGRALIAAD